MRILKFEFWSPVLEVSFISHELILVSQKLKSTVDANSSFIPLVLECDGVNAFHDMVSWTVIKVIIINSYPTDVINNSPN